MLAPFWKEMVDAMFLLAWKLENLINHVHLLIIPFNLVFLFSLLPGLWAFIEGRVSLQRVSGSLICNSNAFCVAVVLCQWYCLVCSNKKKKGSSDHFLEKVTWGIKKKKLLKILSGKFVSNGLSVRGRQDLEIQGPRLNNTKEEKTSIKYGPDRRLDPIITEEMPLLEVCSYFSIHSMEQIAECRATNLLMFKFFLLIHDLLVPSLYLVFQEKLMAFKLSFEIVTVLLECLVCSICSQIIMGCRQEAEKVFFGLFAICPEYFKWVN